MKILVVDDEQDICEILQYNLETEGYEVVTAGSAEEALLEIENGKLKIEDCFPDLILLDVMMEGMSGFQMAHQLKGNAETAHIPIIFITAMDGEDDVVKGLNIGADDYIAKPLSMKEVKARVKAVLRRAAPPIPLPSIASGGLLSFVGPKPHSVASLKTPVAQGEEIFDTTANHVSYEGLSLNLDAKTATLDEQLLTLTKLEFELLTLFLNNQGKVFSREELLERCWPDDVYVLDRTVDVNITRLRKKIAGYGRQLKTRVGYGYYWEK